MLIDGIDGPIARKLNVKEVLPNWSGVMLDNVIDYVTYVLIPAFALYQSGMIGQPLSFVAAGLIVVSSAIYYADMGMKTDENFFCGFPGGLEHAGVHPVRHQPFRDRGFPDCAGGGFHDFPADQFPAPGAGGATAADQSYGFRSLVGAVGIRAAVAFPEPGLADVGGDADRSLSVCHWRDHAAVSGFGAALTATRVKNNDRRQPNP
jgi:hypothetical protein